ncbi:MAG TPA: FAD-dependent oxidoreductase, partial [Dermatophilaceae bacterium]|nr:FAD-dependent oxidoreductase [Dermatophilaceae bacterium]
MPSHDCDLLVLGAGPAGLAAAWQAARRGLAVTVLERAARVGGLSASFEVAGQRVDLGSHRLHPSTDARVLADIAELLGPDLQLRPRHGRLRLAGRWVGFPLRPVELARALPPRLAAAIVRDALTAPLRRAREETYAAYLRAGLGPAVYDELYDPFARKLWGLPGERIHADQARVRVSADSPAKVAARLLRGGRAGRGTEQGRMFFYPARGFGQVSEAVAAAAAGAGADVRLGAEVARLAARPGTVEVRLADGAILRAPLCFSTLPVTALAGLAGRPAADPLRLRAMVLVYLVHGGERWTPYDAHYLPSGATPVTRLSEPKNYRDSPDDPSERSVVCAEIPCDVGDQVWGAADARLVQLVQRTLRDADLPPVRLTGSTVVRLPAVYPVFDLGYRQRLAATAGVPGVVSFGRLGLFAH